ncbi:uncharacterized protein F5891DRAFT_991435 [Suillus fuscotomentosus]|uniref:Uncharacterized protein n=1 Tax=Suillus fuscotomentosus TaxID=1912939 RepID=A0AAD4DMJ1_9AGAM|nr:uncharacterized protein F5891DRAFT_991435 [Suillus fuscotomentosus]KAG1881017.1 hypothetical protein F5891DRAFT_991435 [Suillus fuscotomentosus]
MLLPDPFADSGPPQRQFHQGAYMQDNQDLLERCKALELREIQLTTECDTINRPTRQQYPKIRFLSQDNFMRWLDTASSQTTDRGKIPYLENENGGPVPENTVKAIHKLLRVRDSIKKEDDDDDDDDNTNSNERTLAGKKRKWSTASVEPKFSSKKVKASSELENMPLSPNLDSANTTKPIENTIEPHADTENAIELLDDTTNTTEHLGNTENTTEPFLETKNTTEPLMDSDDTAITVLSNASSEPRSVPAPKPLRTTLPNPLNLCAHRCLKQIKTNGTTDEFCVYYGSLNEEKRKEHDNEANTLVSNMVAVTIYSD